MVEIDYYHIVEIFWKCYIFVPSLSSCDNQDVNLYSCSATVPFRGWLLLYFFILSEKNSKIIHLFIWTIFFWPRSEWRQVVVFFYMKNQNYRTGMIKIFLECFVCNMQMTLVTCNLYLFTVNKSKWRCTWWSISFVVWGNIFSLQTPKNK